MGNYFIEETEEFREEIKKLDKKIYKKVTNEIYPILEKNPIKGNNNIKNLKGKLKRKYRYRIGNYRLIYKVDT